MKVNIIILMLLVCFILLILFILLKIYCDKKCFKGVRCIDCFKKNGKIVFVIIVCFGVIIKKSGLDSKLIVIKFWIIWVFNIIVVKVINKLKI